MTNTVTSTADDMRSMDVEISELRDEVVNFPSSEYKTNALHAIDKWRQDVQTCGIENIKFFDTIEYCDRLQAIRGLIFTLRQQAIDAAAASI